jgi:hypothetical protein
LGLAIEGSLKKGAVGAATVLEALPEGLGVTGTGGERARGLGRFAMVALEPVGERGERLEKVFHGAVILGKIVEFIAIEERRSAGGWSGIDNAGDAQTVFAVDDDDIALSDEASVEEEVDGRMESVIEFDDDTGAEGEDFAEEHAAGTEAQLDVEADIHKAVVTGGGRREGGRRRRWRGGG